MASSSTTDSDVAETFTNSESDDELGTDSACDFDNESDNEDGEQDAQEPFEERRWRVKWFEPKTFTFDSSASGLNSYLPKDNENRPLDYFLLIFDRGLM
ncbi:unnamed protein product [Didymodactylos carnosus]|uniref:Uncharacterized protein n=1 Tax=Didymodactylos carnosus TaxID=1234261 RepID=A0A814KL48_9BILA|nr:unnamed protein product [Didymodactylos carnosus]CAF3822090.1 unnamed protein product [Didymodactylos carnosus]